MSEIEFEICCLCKSFRHHLKTETIFHDFSLSIPSSKITCIIGKSGNGKTTLLNLLAGLTEPDEGEIFWRGESMKNWPRLKRERWRRNTVGYLRQKPILAENETVRSNIQLPFALQGKKINTPLLESLVQDLNMKSFMDSFVWQISAGQQQKTALIRILLKSPDLLLMDEPTSCLDRKSSREIMGLIYNWQRQHNTTVIMVTHDLDLAKNADQIIYIEEGDVKLYESR
ncbi:MAG: ABC transporter ATP-binding protein [Ileibacterium sp.]|nr:ABC transporter ATP-binding protein [Ileibacterium sp.]